MTGFDPTTMDPEQMAPRPQSPPVGAPPTDTGTRIKEREWLQWGFEQVNQVAIMEVKSFLVENLQAEMTRRQEDTYPQAPEDQALWMAQTRSGMADESLPPERAARRIQGAPEEIGQELVDSQAGASFQKNIRTEGEREGRRFGVAARTGAGGKEWIEGLTLAKDDLRKLYDLATRYGLEDLTSTTSPEGVVQQLAGKVRDLANMAGPWALQGEKPFGEEKTEKARKPGGHERLLPRERQRDLFFESARKGYEEEIAKETTSGKILGKVGSIAAFFTPFGGLTALKVGRAVAVKGAEKILGRTLGSGAATMFGWAGATAAGGTFERIHPLSAEDKQNLDHVRETKGEKAAEEAEGALQSLRLLTGIAKWGTIEALGIPLGAVGTAAGTVIPGAAAGAKRVLSGMAAGAALEPSAALAEDNPVTREMYHSIMGQDPSFKTSIGRAFSLMAKGDSKPGEVMEAWKEAARSMGVEALAFGALHLAQMASPVLPPSRRVAAREIVSQMQVAARDALRAKDVLPETLVQKVVPSPEERPVEVPLSFQEAQAERRRTNPTWNEVFQGVLKKGLDTEAGLPQMGGPQSPKARVEPGAVRYLRMGDPSAGRPRLEKALAGVRGKAKDADRRLEEAQEARAEAEREAEPEPARTEGTQITEESFRAGMKQGAEGAKARAKAAAVEAARREVVARERKWIAEKTLQATDEGREDVLTDLRRYREDFEDQSRGEGYVPDVGKRPAAAADVGKPVTDPVVAVQRAIRRGVKDSTIQKELKRDFKLQRSEARKLIEKERGEESLRALKEQEFAETEALSIEESTALVPSLTPGTRFRLRDLFDGREFTVRRQEGSILKVSDGDKQMTLTPGELTRIDPASVVRPEAAPVAEPVKPVEQPPRTVSVRPEEAEAPFAIRAGGKSVPVRVRQEDGRLFATAKLGKGERIAVEGDSLAEVHHKLEQLAKQRSAEPGAGKFTVETPTPLGEQAAQAAEAGRQKQAEKAAKASEQRQKEQEAREEAEQERAPEGVDALVKAIEEATPEVKKARARRGQATGDPLKDFVMEAGGIRWDAVDPNTGKRSWAEEMRTIPLRFRRKSGQTLDNMLAQAKARGLLQEGATESDLIEALQGGRVMLADEGERLQREKYQGPKEMSEAAPPMQVVSVEQLREGSEFTINGEKFRVIEESDLGLRIKDGKEVWLPFEGTAEEASISIDQGSLVGTRETPLPPEAGVLNVGALLGASRGEVLPIKTESTAELRQLYGGMDRMIAERTGLVRTLGGFFSPAVTFGHRIYNVAHEFVAKSKRMEREVRNTLLPALRKYPRDEEGKVLAFDYYNEHTPEAVQAMRDYATRKGKDWGEVEKDLEVLRTMHQRFRKLMNESNPRYQNASRDLRDAERDLLNPNLKPRERQLLEEQRTDLAAEVASMANRGHDEYIKHVFDPANISAYGGKIYTEANRVPTRRVHGSMLKREGAEGYVKDVFVAADRYFFGMIRAIHGTQAAMKLDKLMNGEHRAIGKPRERDDGSLRDPLDYLKKGEQYFYRRTIGADPDAAAGMKTERNLVRVRRWDAEARELWVEREDSGRKFVLTEAQARKLYRKRGGLLDAAARSAGGKWRGKEFEDWFNQEIMGRWVERGWVEKIGGRVSRAVTSWLAQMNLGLLPGNITTPAKSWAMGHLMGATKRGLLPYTEAAMRYMRDPALRQIVEESGALAVDRLPFDVLSEARVFPSLLARAKEKLGEVNMVAMRITDKHNRATAAANGVLEVQAYARKHLKREATKDELHMVARQWADESQLATDSALAGRYWRGKLGIITRPVFQFSRPQFRIFESLLSDLRRGNPAPFVRGIVYSSIADMLFQAATSMVNGGSYTLFGDFGLRVDDIGPAGEFIKKKLGKEWGSLMLIPGFPFKSILEGKPPGIQWLGALTGVVTGLFGEGGRPELAAEQAASLTYGPGRRKVVQALSARPIRMPGHEDEVEIPHPATVGEAVNPLTTKFTGQAGQRMPKSEPVQKLYTPGTSVRGEETWDLRKKLQGIGKDMKDVTQRQNQAFMNMRRAQREGREEDAKVFKAEYLQLREETGRPSDLDRIVEMERWEKLPPEVRTLASVSKEARMQMVSEILEDKSSPYSMATRRDIVRIIEMGADPFAGTTKETRQRYRSAKQATFK